MRPYRNAVGAIVGEIPAAKENKSGSVDHKKRRKSQSGEKRSVSRAFEARKTGDNALVLEGAPGLRPKETRGFREQELAGGPPGHMRGLILQRLQPGSRTGG